MSSIRHKDRLLDAAREVIMGVGWKRATLTDVARRAGLSRMTVYRNYPDMQRLTADLMTREWVQEITRVLDAIDADSREPETTDDGLDLMGRRFTAAVAALRDNDLFTRISSIDPELLLPYLIDRRGQSQDQILDVLAERISRAQASGQVRDGDPMLLAKTLTLSAYGFVLSMRTMADAGHSEADLDSELTLLTRRYLAP